jgi:sugar phosphate isomerase/epimerase
MMKTGVQQIMLGTVSGTAEKAEKTLRLISGYGYDGIELNSFMIHPMGFLVKLMTKAAGMPIGKGGKLDWHTLVKNSGCSVISLHTDLGSLERDAQSVIQEAKAFGTEYCVITGMYRFDYSNRNEVLSLCERLNRAGTVLKEAGLQLLYHNHNCELQHVSDTERAFDLLLEHTDPACVNFEFDSYWYTEAGGNALAMMKRMGNRMKLWHINDRGCRKTGPYMTPILKCDAVELGKGNMDLESLWKQAEANGCEAVVLEQHKNFIDHDPLKSIAFSAQWLKKHTEVKP